MRKWMMGLCALAALGLLVFSQVLNPAVSFWVVLLLSLIFGFGWPRFVAPEGGAVSTVATTLVGVGAVCSVQFVGGTSYVGGVSLVLAGGLVVLMGSHVFFSAREQRHLDVLMRYCSGIVIAASGAGWLALERLSSQMHILPVALGAVAAAVGVSMLPWPDRVLGPLGVLLGALVGVLVCVGVVDDEHIVVAGGVGLVCAAVVAGFRRASSLTGSPRSLRAWLAASIAPVLALGAFVYFTDKLLAFSV